MILGGGKKERGREKVMEEVMRYSMQLVAFSQLYCNLIITSKGRIKFIHTDLSTYRKNVGDSSIHKTLTHFH